jgi:hypothetical protein
MPWCAVTGPARRSLRFASPAGAPATSAAPASGWRSPAGPPEPPHWPRRQPPARISPWLRLRDRPPPVGRGAAVLAHPQQCRPVWPAPQRAPRARRLHGAVQRALAPGATAGRRAGDARPAGCRAGKDAAAARPSRRRTTRRPRVGAPTPRPATPSAAASCSSSTSTAARPGWARRAPGSCTRSSRPCSTSSASGWCGCPSAGSSRGGSALRRPGPGRTR